jgi:hypothetical protein
VTRSCALFACVLVVAGCARSCSSGEVAELRAIVGTVQRDVASSQGVWKSARSGHVFSVGDGLRTGAGARAELLLVPDGRLRVEADTVVRFSDAPPGERDGTVDVETGSVEIESGTSELLIEAPEGLARVAEGSRVRVRRGAKGAVGLEVAVGRAQIEHGNETVTAREGETLALSIGRVEVERGEPTAVEAETSEETEPPPAPAAQVEVELEPGIEASVAAELEVPAGESATVHDPRPPIAVGFRATDCAQGTELELRAFGGGVRRIREAAGRAGTALGTPAARLNAGSYRYSVRCLGDSAGSTRGNGVLRVVRDSGGRSLPRTAPKVSLDADGRRYTVRYQNLLPELRLRWPGAPPASTYSLELIAEDGTALRESSGSPELRLRSGRVREGEYRFVVRAGAARSPETVLRVAFDDTARTAQLSEPRDHAFQSGGAVRVSGAALASSSVRVGDVLLALASDGRFESSVSAPPAGRVLAVRVQHPIAGVHYYVRRPASAR